MKLNLFRSTGSYEPDLLGYGLPDWSLVFRSTGSYEPDRINRYINIVSKTVSIHRLLRAWPSRKIIKCYPGKVSIHRLLRAWPNWKYNWKQRTWVSIHRLLRAWPIRIILSEDEEMVSIHRLLRAWPGNASGECWRQRRFRSTGSYEPDPCGAWQGLII